MLLVLGAKPVLDRAFALDVLKSMHLGWRVAVVCSFSEVLTAVNINEENALKAIAHL